MFVWSVFVWFVFKYASGSPENGYEVEPPQK